MRLFRVLLPDHALPVVLLVLQARFKTPTDDTGRLRFSDTIYAQRRRTRAAVLRVRSVCCLLHCCFVLHFSSFR